MRKELAVALLALAACKSKPQETPSDAAFIGPPPLAVADAGDPRLFVPIRDVYALAGDERFLYAASEATNTYVVYRIAKSGGATERIGWIEHQRVSAMTVSDGALWVMAPNAGAGELRFWNGAGEPKVVAEDLAHAGSTFANGYLYFASDQTVPVIARVPLLRDGGAPGKPESLGTLPADTRAGNLRLCGGRLFFTIPAAHLHAGNGTVLYGASLVTKKNPTAIATFDQEHVTSLACDAKHLYVQRESQAPTRLGGVWRKPLEGGGAFEEVVRSLSLLAEIALDETSVYVSANAGLVKVDKTTKVSTRLVELPIALGISLNAIHVDGTHAYWATPEGLYRTPKNQAAE